MCSTLDRRWLLGESWLSAWNGSALSICVVSADEDGSCWGSRAIFIGGEAIDLLVALGVVKTSPKRVRQDGESKEAGLLAVSGSREDR